MRCVRWFPLLALPIALLACGDDPDRTPNGDGAAGPTYSGAAEICVAAINQYRAGIGQPAYAHWAAVEPCADDQAQSDSETGQGHGAFGQCGETGQCECPGWPGPPEDMIEDCLAMMWAEGPGGGHHDLMASPNHTEVACGFYVTASGSVWAVQDYR